MSLIDLVIALQDLICLNSIQNMSTIRTYIYFNNLAELNVIRLPMSELIYASYESNQISLLSGNGIIDDMPITLNNFRTLLVEAETKFQDILSDKTSPKDKLQLLRHILNRAEDVMDQLYGIDELSGCGREGEQIHTIFREFRARIYGETDFINFLQSNIWTGSSLSLFARKHIVEGADFISSPDSSLITDEISDARAAYSRVYSGRDLFPPYQVPPEVRWLPGTPISTLDQDGFIQTSPLAGALVNTYCTLADCRGGFLEARRGAYEEQLAEPAARIVARLQSFAKAQGAPHYAAYRGERASMPLTDIRGVLGDSLLLVAAKLNPIISSLYEGTGLKVDLANTPFLLKREALGQIQEAPKISPRQLLDAFVAWQNDLGLVQFSQRPTTLNSSASAQSITWQLDREGYGSALVEIYTNIYNDPNSFNWRYANRDEMGQSFAQRFQLWFKSDLDEVIKIPFERAMLVLSHESGHMFELFFSLIKRQDIDAIEGMEFFSMTLEYMFKDKKFLKMFFEKYLKYNGDIDALVNICSDRVDTLVSVFQYTVRSICDLEIYSRFIDQEDDKENAIHLLAVITEVLGEIRADLEELGLSTVADALLYHPADFLHLQLLFGVAGTDDYPAAMYKYILGDIFGSVLANNVLKADDPKRGFADLFDLISCSETDDSEDGFAGVILKHLGSMKDLLRLFENSVNESE